MHFNDYVTCWNIIRLNIVIDVDPRLVPVLVFGKIAKELISISLAKMAAKEKVDRNVFPQGVIDLFDNKYRFQVGLTYKAIQNKTLTTKSLMQSRLSPLNLQMCHNKKHKIKVKAQLILNNNCNQFQLPYHIK